MLSAGLKNSFGMGRGDPRNHTLSFLFSSVEFFQKMHPLIKSLCWSKGCKVMVCQILIMILSWVKPRPPASGSTLVEWQIFFLLKPPTLTAHNFAAVWPIEIHNTSLENPYSDLAHYQAITSRWVKIFLKMLEHGVCISLNAFWSQFSYFEII